MSDNFVEEGTQLHSGHSASRSLISISLSTAALHLSGGGSMFGRTGSHGSAAEHRVPVTTGMVELSCTSMRSVCNKRDQIGQQQQY